MKVINYFKKRDNYDILAFVVTAILAAIVFTIGDRMIGGRYVIMYGDFWEQNVSFIRLFYRKLFALDGSISQFLYSFEVSLGDDISAQFAYFGVFSPFNIVYLIFDDVNVASSLLIILKLSTSALLFYKFTGYVFNKKGLPYAVIAVLYAMCGYNICCYYNPHFLEGPMLLPLLMLLLVRFIKTRKWIALSLIYAYSFIVCFYVGYLLGIFSFLALVLYLIFIYKPAKKILISIIVRYIGLVVLAFMLSAFITLPAAKYILSNVPSDRTTINSLGLNILDIYGNLFMGMYQGEEGVFPYIYSGLISLFAVPFFFFSRKYKKNVKIFAGIILGFLIFCSLVVPMYLMMHMFDAPDQSGFRFAYFYSFLFISILAYTFENFVNASKIKISIIAFINVILFAFIWWNQNRIYTGKLNSIILLKAEFNLLFIILCVGALFWKKYKSNNGKNKVFAIITIMEIVVSYCFVTTNFFYADNEYKTRTTYIEKQRNEMFEKINELEGNNNDFYRVFYENPLLVNYPTYVGYKGLGYFSTFENEKLRNTLRCLGYGTSARIVFDFGTTPVSRMLLGQKYELYSYGDYNDYIKVVPEVKKNQYYLGIGYIVNKDIENISLATEDPFDNINSVISSMIGEDVKVYNNINELASNNQNNVEIYTPETKNQRALMLTGDNSTGHIQIMFSSKKGNENILGYISRKDESNYALNAPVFYSATGDWGAVCVYPTVYMSYIINLGCNRDDIPDATIAFDENSIYRAFDFNNLYFYEYNESAMISAYNKLKDGRFIVELYKDGYIKGSVDVDADGKNLFLSIPYDKNWKAYIDGKSVDIIPVINESFISIPLNKGEHIVVLKYVNSFAIIGSWISMFAILVLAMLYITEKHKITLHKDF